MFQVIRGKIYKDIWKSSNLLFGSIYYMSTVDKICPVCKKNNEIEAVVCRHCGAAFDGQFLDMADGTKTTNVPIPFPEQTRDWSIDEASVPEYGIAIYVEGEFKPVLVDTKEEFVIGRKSGKTSEVSEGLLDLSPLGGYSRGVSRRHATILRTEQGYEILDLGSVNGSWLNDERLVPQKHYPLPSRSHLRLGSMRLFVLYRPFADTKQ